MKKDYQLAEMGLQFQREKRYDDAIYCFTKALVSIDISSFVSTLQEYLSTLLSNNYPSSFFTAGQET